MRLPRDTTTAKDRCLRDSDTDNSAEETAGVWGGWGKLIELSTIDAVKVPTENQFLRNLQIDGLLEFRFARYSSSSLHEVFDNSGLI